MSDVLYENKKLFFGMLIVMFSIVLVCAFLYISQIFIPFWLVAVTILVSIPICGLLISYRKKLIKDISLFKTQGHALYEIPCSCIYNGYQIDSAKLFIHQFGIEYIDTDRFSYFGFIPFTDILSVDLIESQLQITCNILLNKVTFALESDNLLDLQLIYTACECNGANFDDNFVLFCNDMN